MSANHYNGAVPQGTARPERPPRPGRHTPGPTVLSISEFG